MTEADSRTRSRPRRRLPTRPALAAAVLGVAASIASPAGADERTDARSLFREGMELVTAGQHERGIPLLIRAYETLPHPNVLYNIGRAYAEAGDFEASIAWFIQYVETDPDDRDEVAGFIESMREQLTAARAPAPEAAAAAPVVTEDRAAQRATVEEAVATLDALAPVFDAQGGDQLRALGARLRGLAESMAAPPADEPPRAAPPPAPAPPPVVVPRLDDDDERSADIYEEEVVSASRFAETSVGAPNSTTIITDQDIRLSADLVVPEMLRRAAGVEIMTLSAGDSEVAIRGLNQRLSNKVIVLIDGRSVYIDAVGATMWSLLPLTNEDIERIEIIRGPASALYGADAFGGLINIITRDPAEERSVASITLGSLGTGRVAATGSFREGPLSIRVSGGGIQADAFSVETAADRVDVEQVLDDPTLGRQHLWANFEARWRPARGYRVTLGAGALAGDHTAQGIGRIRDIGWNSVIFSQTHARVDTPVGLTLRTYWTRLDGDLQTTDGRRGALPFASLGTTVHSADTEASLARELDLGFPHNIVVGLGHRYKGGDWAWINQSPDEHHFSLFAHDTMTVTDAFAIVASARVDQHPLLSDPQFSPRAAVVIAPSEGSALRASVAFAFRSPTFLESYLGVDVPVPVRGATTNSFGDPTLDPERITAFEVGYSNQASDVFAVEANGYFNLVQNAILLTRTRRYSLYEFETGDDPRIGFHEDTRAFPFAELGFENEDATFYQAGGELGAKVFPVRGLDVYANYSLHQTAPLGRTDLEGRELDQRTSAHKINAGVQYRSDVGLDLSLDLHWVDSQVWVEQVTDVARGTVVFAAFELPAYALLNARVGYRMLDDHLELAVAGTNLVDPDHREHPYGQRIDTRVFGTARVTF